ncbi:MAG: flavodoxin family protein [Candidatus Odinarchaeota archaeon]
MKKITTGKNVDKTSTSSNRKGVKMMALKVLGISGSPVKEGNTETYLQYMLEIATRKGLSCETVNLSEVDISDCKHCNFCIRKQSSEKYCAIDDGAQSIFKKAEQADIIILASPVYFMRTSGRMAALIDRLRVFLYGNHTGGKLKNKIGVSAAVSWWRNGGLETTHLSHIQAFITLGMIPTGARKGVSPLGASAVASPNGSGKFDRNSRLGVRQDELGLQSAAATMERAIELATLINRGKGC